MRPADGQTTPAAPAMASSAARQRGQATAAARPGGRAARLCIFPLDWLDRDGQVGELGATLAELLLADAHPDGGRAAWLGRRGRATAGRPDDGVVARAGWPGWSVDAAARGTAGRNGA
ncbi:hypothetical protein U9M48_027843 [Paspalum notatum var. saurae]|uniref:Uncharacterized protein n=1 Tax=Paspalum notatum var. saurae TaxID=547442 RepID=A0AAQ3WZY5_PASNO